MTKTINFSFIQKHIAAVVMVSAMFFGMMAFANPAQAQSYTVASSAGPSISDLQAQIAALQAQLNRLLSQVGSPSGLQNNSVGSARSTISGGASSGVDYSGGSNTATARTVSDIASGGSNYGSNENRTTVSDVASARTSYESGTERAAAVSYMTPPPSVPETNQFSRNLRLGDRNSQVRELNSCLAGLGHYNGSDSNAFSAATERAVKAFQAAQGVVSSGNAWTTGYGTVGPKTRAALNSACVGETVVPNEENMPMPEEITDDAYNLTASPKSGKQPLLVKFTASHGDNSTYKPGLTGGAETRINWGDGSTAVWVSCYHAGGTFGECNNDKKLFHVYTEPGTYTAKLKRVGGRNDLNEVLDKVTITVGETSDYEQADDLIVDLTKNGQEQSVTLTYMTQNCDTGYYVRWGDGSQDDVVNPGDCTEDEEVELTHTYDQEGSYNVRLTYADQVWKETVTIGAGGVEEVYARIQYRQAEASGGNVNGTRVLLADGTKYAEAEWFRLTENGEWIDDDVDVQSVDGAAAFRGLVVSRTGDGNFAVGHIGGNDTGVGSELSEGRIVVKNASFIRSAVDDSKFERHPGPSDKYETRYELDYVRYEEPTKVQFGTRVTTGSDIIKLQVEMPEGAVEGISTTDFGNQIANALTALDAALDRLEVSLK